MTPAQQDIHINYTSGPPGTRMLMAWDVPEVKTGKLQPFFDRFVFCIDCGTDFVPHSMLIHGRLKLTGNGRCNGSVIDLCPWCRPDSAPNMNGV